MYDRAARNFSWMIGGAPPCVGPGSYTICDVPVKCDPSSYEGYAPFLSLDGRKPIVEGSIWRPGPGQYDPVKPTNYVKSAVGLVSKSERFPCTRITQPGPGSYEVGDAPKCVRMPALQRSKSQSCDDLNLTRRLRYQRPPAPPSIPCAGQAYGYEETADGALAKQLPPVTDVSLGPAFYAPAMEEAPPTRLYKGIHWGSMKAKRNLFEPKPGPAPGDYEPYPEPPPVLPHVPTSGDKLADYYAEREKQINKQGVPGPGTYRIVRDFDEACSHKYNCDGELFDQAPFLVQSKRFTAHKSPGPGPGSYEDPRGCADSLQRKVTSMRRTPFGQTAPRFTEGHMDDFPGPNAYRVRQPGCAGWRTLRCAERVHGAFNSTAERRTSLAHKEAPDLPGPAHYTVPLVPTRVKTIPLSSSFATQTVRGIASALEKENPPPGSYDVIESFHRTQDRVPPRPPRSEQARRSHESFLASTCRFSLPRDQPVAEPDPRAPGPGLYDPKQPGCKIGNKMTSRDRRFREDNTDAIPAPNAYELSPLIQDSVLRGTFNVTLGGGYHPTNNPLKRVSAMSLAGQA